jgi:hypothetical protein
MMRSELRALQREFVKVGVRRAAESLDTARALLEAGFPSPALVWAERAAEIFIRDALLFPVEYGEQFDIRKAMKAASGVFGSGKWTRSVAKVRAAYGLGDPEHDALDPDGDDAWADWARFVIGYRGDVVHGRREATSEAAAELIGWVEHLHVWFMIQILVGDAGPGEGIVAELFERLSASAADDAPRPDAHHLESEAFLTAGDADDEAVN